MAVDQPRRASCTLDHAVEERNQETVGAILERFLAVVTLPPDEAVAEREEDRQPGKTLLESRHQLTSAAPGHRCVFGPAAAPRIALLREIKELRLVRLGIEKNALATAGPGELRGQAGVGERGSVVVEPVEIGRRDVETEEVVPRPRPRDRSQVVERGLEMRRE